MRKDTSFSDKKLSTEEFSRKYWHNGEIPYQYHTGQIEDGRDEREQFVFNNIRAIWERMKENNKNNLYERGKIWSQLLDHERRLSKVTFMVMLVAVFQICEALRNND